MIKVVLTANLKKYYPKSQFEIEARTLRDLLTQMDQVRPHFSDYIVDGGMVIRKHVNVFINGNVLKDKSHIDVKLEPGSQVHIMQALSGG